MTNGSQNETWSPRGTGPLGRAQRRLEDSRLVTGQGRYVADLISAETLHAHFVRSPIAHGDLTGLDTTGARSMPGVVEIVTAETLALADLPPPPGIDRDDVKRPLLARDRVRYVGEPIAMVVAESAAQAADASDLVWPDIDEISPALATDPVEAVDEPNLFEGDNVLITSISNENTSSSGSFPAKVSVELHNQRLAAVAIEGLAILAEPQPNGGLKVTCGHQGPHRLRDQLASALAMDPGDVRVVVPDVGGAFGLKGMFFTEYVAVAATALRMGTPLVWLESRREHLVAGMHGRAQTHRVTLEGETSGEIRRARIEIVADVGAYPQSGALVPSLSRFVAGGLYDIADLVTEMSIVVTNRAPTGSYRGAGRPEAAFAIERAVDVFAREVGIDPAEVRRINFIQSSQLPYQAATGALYDSGDYTAALDLALSLVDIAGLREEQQKRLEEGANPIGVGIGAFIERTGGAADTGEFADVELAPGGKIIVRTGSTDSGQGHKTVWSQAMAEVFTVDQSAVEVRSGDTDEVADGIGTYASRSAQLGTSAAYRMANKVKERAREMVAEMLEASPDDLRLQDGAFHVVGVPESAITLSEIAAHAETQGESIRYEEMFIPGVQTFPYGAYLSVVEVDLETGVVAVRKVVTVDDCGNVLNPMIVGGQLQGSLVQGLGQTLSEGVVYNESGAPVTSTLMDYLIPTAADLPEVVSGRIVTPAPSNPLGVKGTGEAGCIGGPPAIVNAVLDALGPYGVTDLQMPLRPDRVWSAIQAAKPV